METPVDQSPAPKPPFYQRKEFPPLAVFGAFLLILFLSTAFSGRPPVIDRISQEDNLASMIVTIEGKNFGAPGAGGEVHIGTLALTSSNFLKWSEEEIVVSIPREVSSGIVSVVTKNGRGRGDIYLNPDEIPRRTRGPLIAALSPQNAAPGRVITLKGERFGAQRLGSRVLFSQVLPAEGRSGNGDQAEALLGAAENDLDYLFWSDAEIRVRVPDGAKTGLVVVSTDKAQSNYKFITVMPESGKKSYRNRIRYRLRAGVILSVYEAAAPNTLALFLPRPVSGPDQRRVEIKNASAGRSAAPPPGVEAFTLIDLASARPERLVLEYELERYEVISQIDPALIRAAFDPADPFVIAFTGDDPAVRPSHPAVAALVRAAAGDEKNPYLAARRVYDFVIDQFTPEDSGRDPSDWPTLIPGRRADAFAYAALCASLLRKAGVPARLAAGFLADQTKAVRPHYWCEFFLPDFGWVPADPYLGEGAAPDAPVVAGARDYYFGNLDNRHLAFAKGFIPLPPPNPQERTAVKSGVVGLQSYHEKAGGGLKTYSSVWERVKILALD